MNSNTKRPTVARTSTSDEEEEDRLSSLPDSVLCHILSFLPTKYAAITSVLSTKWKCLFLGVPNIDLDDSLLLKPPQEEQGSRTNVDHNFVSFVNMRLMLCKTSSLTQFRLKCRRSPEAPVINLWLTTLLSRRVKVVQIEVQSKDSPPFWLPSGIFWSQSLVVLKLCGGNIVFKIPEFVCFPNLKVLHLEDLDMQCESNNFRLAEEGYHLLEDLRLEKIRFQKSKDGRNDAILGISLGTMKKLTLVGVESEFSRIDIETPHLQHLEYEFTWSGVEEPPMQINLYKCESLVSANLLISEIPIFSTNERWFIELLSKLSNVKKLRLCIGFSEIVSWHTDSLPRFPNLTHLEITATEGPEWILLRRAPNLKVLVCNMVCADCSDLPQEYDPWCLAENLREIRIRNFEGYGGDFAVVGYLLQHGPVLARMSIERRGFMKEEWAVSTLKQLLKLGRRSPNCEIELI